jgi:DNA-binding transcriptional MerR regulator
MVTTSFTRAQIAQTVGVSPNTVQHWERSELLSPSVRQVDLRGGLANLYSPVDVALAQFISRARSIGMTRPALRSALDQLAADRNLVPGYEGWVVLTGDERVRVNTDPAILIEMVIATGAEIALFARISVPEET